MHKSATNALEYSVNAELCQYVQLHSVPGMGGGDDNGYSYWQLYSLMAAFERGDLETVRACVMRDVEATYQLFFKDKRGYI